MNTPVGELDRGLQMLGYLLRQNECSIQECPLLVWTIRDRPLVLVSTVEASLGVIGQCNHEESINGNKRVRANCEAL